MRPTAPPLDWRGQIPPSRRRLCRKHAARLSHGCADLRGVVCTGGCGSLHREDRNHLLVSSAQGPDDAPATVRRRLFAIRKAHLVLDYPIRPRQRPWT